ncbi:MAG TPA: serine protease [Kineosporiaceae bacterium]
MVMLVMGGLVAGSATAADAIVGGHPATQLYPAMVSIQKKDSKGEYMHDCGAVLIDPRWAVTAGHCASADSKSDRIRIGSSKWNANGQVVSVTQEIRFPAGSARSSYQDIGLLKLAIPVSYRPMKLGRVPAVGSPVRLIGWGVTSPDSEEYPVELQEVDSALTRGTVCQHTHPGDLCVEDPQHRGTSGCDGDSGGPLMVHQAGEWRLIGVTSRNGGSGPACEASGIYTNVPQNRAWIEKTIGHPLP